MPCNRMRKNVGGGEPARTQALEKGRNSTKETEARHTTEGTESQETRMTPTHVRRQTILGPVLKYSEQLFAAVTWFSH